MPLEHWKHSLRQTFRLLPTPSPHLRVFLNSNSKHKDEVLAELPYAPSRSPSPSAAAAPDPKRYRDSRYVYESIGLLYEDEAGIVRLTELGEAVSRWLDILTEPNAKILGGPLAYALGAIQLKNPTKPGQEYADSVCVFPAQYIWFAMLELGNRISSDEINRGIMRTANFSDLESAIERIKIARLDGNLDRIGIETVTGNQKNDRIIPWMSIASFGWTLIADKSGGYYELKPWAIPLVRQSISIPRRHKNFPDTRTYIESISNAACLPPNLRK